MKTVGFKIMHQVSFRLPEKMEKKVEQIAGSYGLNKSEIFRQSLSIYLNLLNNSQKLTNLRNLEVENVKISKEKTRNLFILDLNDLNSSLVISTSSSGAIGSKEEDNFKVNPSLLGKIILRASFGKIISIKANPVSSLLSFSTEYDPTGKKILDGAKKEAKKIGVEDVSPSHSEENFKTKQTGVSVFSIGLLNGKKRKKNYTHGDYVFSIGKPLLGKEFLENNDTPTLTDLKEISKIKRS